MDEIGEGEKSDSRGGERRAGALQQSKFVSQAMVAAKGNVSAEIFLKKGPGNLQSVFGLDRK